MLAASLLVHAFLTPFPALLGLIGMLPALKVSDETEVVEIELTTLPVAQSPADPKPDPPPPIEPPDAEAASQAPPPEPETQPEVEAPKPAETSDPSPKPPPPSQDPPEKIAPNELYSDPIALAGDAAQVADSNANVRLFIFADVIREQPLGERVGALLKRTPQWSDFFGTADIDPIRDVDRVLIAGPQLRSSSQVVAVVQHHMSPPIIDAAFNQLVRRRGEWIDREKRMARAHADRAPRIFAAPNDSVVIVAPPQMEDQLKGLGERSRFAEGKGDIALSAYLVTPYRVARGTGIELPRTLKWARLDLRPAPDGGGVLKILIQDRDVESARQNTQLFQVLVDQVATIDLSKGGGLGAMASMLLGSKKVKMLKEASFAAKGDQIEGTVVATKAQLLNLADLLDAFLPPPAKKDPEEGQESSNKEPGQQPSSPEGEIDSAQQGESLPAERGSEPGQPTSDRSANDSTVEEIAQPRSDSPSVDGSVATPALP